MNKTIHIRDLSFSFQNQSVLKNINLEIEKGKLTVITGRNGSGKSTFLRILAGLLPFKQGCIEIFGKQLSQMSYSERAKKIGFLNQKHQAVFPFSVKDVVLTGRAGYVRFVPEEKERDAAYTAMQKIGISHLSERNYSELSGGEQQLVMIARVLAQEPEILLLDEPVSHLDYNHQLHLLKLLKELAGIGFTVVVVLHDPNLAFLFGEDFLFVNEKQIIRPDNPYDKVFLETVYQCSLEILPFQNKIILVPGII